MVRKSLFGLLWLGLIGYAVFLAPPDQPDALTLIQHLSTGQWRQINPWIIALFNAMGIWPLLYCGVVFTDGDGQPLRAWPFALASAAVGAFAMLPYLMLRTPHQNWSGKPTLGLRLWDSRWLGAVALVGTVACLGLGMTQGNWPDFVQQWQTSRFIHVMGLDFCCLSLLFPTLVPDDLARRGQPQARGLLLISLVPLIGPCLYLLSRATLVQSTQMQNSVQSVS
jgi:hypothetical protein